MGASRTSTACSRSPGAFALYRTLVEKSNQTPVTVHTTFALTEAELTWFELTAVEADVFGIDPRLLNALALAYVRYSDLIGMTDEEFSAFRDEERKAFPNFFKGERVFSAEIAADFMATACVVP